jgi:flagellar assembly protein FliH
MILLSDQKYNHKIISIKKMNDIKQKNSGIKPIDERHAQLKEEIKQFELNIADLQQKKEKMVQELRETIKSERDSWQETKEKEQQKVRKVAYKMGYDEGLEKVQGEWDSKLKEANEIIRDAKKDYFHTLEQHEETIVQLAITAAEKVLKKALDDNKGYYLTIVKEAIETLQDRSHLTIYVPSDYFSFVMQQKEELEGLLEDGNVLSIYADTGLEDGECAIKHPFGQIEVGIDVQLEQLKNMLIEKIRES